MDTVILKYILSSQGSVDREELECNLGDASLIAHIIDSDDKLVSCSVRGAVKVVARCEVSLCRAPVCAGCGGLHVCPDLLLSGAGGCCSRRACSFSHELHSEYNMEVLREFGLESLSSTELCLLLLQSNNTLLPQICHDYNNACGCWVDCQRLHVCERFLCSDACGCTRAHDFSAAQPLRLLQKKRIPRDLFKVLKSVYANKEALWLAEKTNANNNNGTQAGSGGTSEFELSEIRRDPVIDGDSDSSDGVRTKPNQSGRRGGQRKIRGGKGRRRAKQQNKTPSAASGCGFQDPKPTAQRREGNNSSSALSIGQSKENRSGYAYAADKGNGICMFFIRGHCHHEDSCVKAHDRMPYRWQIKDGAFWIPLAKNEMIEEDYCDPKKTCSATCASVDFETMRCGQNKVRRQSTVNSVVKPNYSHTTDWLWYWEDKDGQWYQYAPSKHRLIHITSKTLEEKYVENPRDVVMFTAGSQVHELIFQDMIERNRTNGTIRHVRRRPRFVSAAEVQAKRKCSTNTTAVPFYLDKTQSAQMLNAFSTIEQLQPTPKTCRTTIEKAESTKLSDPFSVLSIFGSHLTTGSTTNTQKTSTAPATNLATSPRVTRATTSASVSTKTSKKSQLGPSDTFSLTKPLPLISTQATDVLFTLAVISSASLETSATNSVNTFSARSQPTTESQFTFTTQQSTSANWKFITPASGAKLPPSQITSASATAVNLAHIFSNTTAISGFESSKPVSTYSSQSKSPSTTSTWATQSPNALTSETSAAVASPAEATKQTSSAVRSHMTPTASPAEHSTSSMRKAPGLNPSNPLSTDLKASKREATTTVTTKAQFTSSPTLSSAQSTCRLKSPFSTDLPLLKSEPMTSQTTKSQITHATTAVTQLPTSKITSSTNSFNSSNALPTSAKQFSPTFSADSSQKMTSARAQVSKIPPNQFSASSQCNVTTKISAAKSQVTPSSSSSNSFSISSSTKPQSIATSAFSNTTLAATASPLKSLGTSPASPATTAQSVSHVTNSATLRRSQTTSGASSPKAFSTTAMESTFTVSASATSTATPRSTATATQNKKSCIIS